MKRKTFERGFTLVEILIALVLSSMLMLGLVIALATFGATSERIEKRTHASDDVRLVFAFLERSLSHAARRARRDIAIGPDVGEQIWFNGEHTRLEWLGLMPARHGVGGLMHFLLTLEMIEGQQALMLRFSPYDVGGEGPEWASTEPQILILGVESLSVAYQPLAEEEWLPDWGGQAELPGRISITLALPGEVWAPLVVSVFGAREVALLNERKKWLVRV